MVGLFDEALHLAESGMLPRDYVVEEISEEANRMVEGERRVFIVYFLARVGQTVPTTNLILAGVAFSSFATSLTSFLMLRSTNEVRRALGWLLGGASQAGWTAILAMLPYLVIGLGILVFFGYRLNLLQFGDDQAQQMGVNVTRTKTILLIASSLATAAAVAFSGIIG